MADDKCKFHIQNKIHVTSKNGNFHQKISKLYGPWKKLKIFATPKQKTWLRSLLNSFINHFANWMMNTVMNAWSTLDKMESISLRCSEIGLSILLADKR